MKNRCRAMTQLVSEPQSDHGCDRRMWLSEVLFDLTRRGNEGRDRRAGNEQSAPTPCAAKTALVKKEFRPAMTRSRTGNRAARQFRRPGRLEPRLAIHDRAGNARTARLPG